MQKWEYCRIRHTVTTAKTPEEAKLLEQLANERPEYFLLKDNDFTSVSQVILTYLGDESGTKSFRNLNKLMAKLGNEGWELVSCNQTHEPVNSEIYYFKRPVQEK